MPVQHILNCIRICVVMRHALRQLHLDLYDFTINLMYSYIDRLIDR